MSKETSTLKITCLILARGGSKGIPLKNIKILNGIPLLGWTLRAARDWKRFESIWVSTDNDEIAHVARHFGAQVHRRSADVSGDETPSIDAVQEFLSSHEEVDILALVQCTSPCLQPPFLEEAYQMICRQNYDVVFSVCRTHHLRWTEIENGGSTNAVNFDPAKRPRRQDWTGELVECGMFYFVTAELIKLGLLQGGKCGYVEIPREYALEIDSYYDWLIAEAVIPKYGFVPV